MLKNTIPTLIAFTIIIILALIVGMVDYWQYTEIQNIVSELQALKISYKKILKDETKVEDGTELENETIEIYEIVKDEITGWNIYRNFEYEFEIKYPLAFTIDNNPQYFTTDTIISLSPQEPDMSITVRVVSKEEHQGPSGKILLEDEIVNDISFQMDYLYQYEGMGQCVIGVNGFTEYKDKYYIITATTFPMVGYFRNVVPEDMWAGERTFTQEGLEYIAKKMANREKEFMKIFDQILSTFRFLE